MKHSRVNEKTFETATLHIQHLLTSFPDLRLQLGATDYGTLLQNEPSPIATSTVAEKLTQSLVDEFDYVKSNAVQPLSKFLDYIT